MNRTFVIGLVLTAMLGLGTPAFAQATNTDETMYRGYLLSLIELLQQQIILLKASEANVVTNPIEPKQATNDDFESFLFTDIDDIVAWYEISNSDEVRQLSNKTHRQYFTRFFELVPDQYDEYFVDLVVFGERNNDFDGFVETVSPYRGVTWRIAINESMFDFSLTSDVVEELFVHEFAHIVSYAGINSVPVSSQARCHEWFDEFGCPPGDAYLLDFLEEFWSEDELDQLVDDGDTDDMWNTKERRERFVTEYASTDPAEDFAESFTYFVLQDQPESNSMVAEKIEYFYGFPELLDLRSEIRTQL